MNVREKLLEIERTLRRAWLDTYGVIEHLGRSNCELLVCSLDSLSLTKRLRDGFAKELLESRHCVECGDPLGGVPDAVNVCAACEAKPVCEHCGNDLGGEGYLRKEASGKSVLLCLDCVGAFDTDLHVGG